MLNKKKILLQILIVSTLTVQHTAFCFPISTSLPIQNITRTWYFLIDTRNVNPSVSMSSEDYDLIRRNWVKGQEIIEVYENQLLQNSAKPRFDTLIDKNTGKNLETINGSGQTNCAIGLDALGGIRNAYRLCNSTLIQERPVGTFFQNTIGAVFTLGTGMGHTVVYDPTKLDKLLETDSIKTDIKDKIYQYDVTSTTINMPTSEKYQRFIDKYKDGDYDPEKMVDVLKTDLPKLQARETNAIIEKQNRQKAKAEEEAKALSNFRSTIKPGDKTNCGLVVNVQDRIIQVQTSLGLVWMKRDKILSTDYPYTYSCNSN